MAILNHQPTIIVKIIFHSRFEPSVYVYSLSEYVRLDYLVPPLRAARQSEASAS